MAIRTAKLYQGEDMAPVLDYTDQVIWEESEFGTRAWLGEGNPSTVVIRDPLGEQGSALSLPAGLTSKSLASKNLFVIQLGTDYMFRGRVGIKNYSRDSQHVERYRQVECQLHDTNWDLHHIFVHDYVRPAENDIQRAQGVIASYLSGSPRESTVLNGSNFLSGSNTVSLPANTYKQTSPLGVLREVAVTANKQFFVTGDSLTGGSLFWDGNDSTVYNAGIRISDRINEIDTEGSCSPGDVSVVDNGINTGSGNVPIQWDNGSGTGNQDLTIAAGDINRALYTINLHRHDAVAPTPVWRRAGPVDEAFTLIAGPQGNVGATGTIRIYRLLNPTPGMGQVLDTAGGSARMGGFYLTGVDQSNPEASTDTNDNDGVTASGVTVTGGALYLDGAGMLNLNETSVGNPTPSGAQAQAWSVSLDALPGFDDLEFGGSSGDSTPTWTSASSRNWVAAAVAVNSAGAAGAALTFPPIWNVGPASTEDGSEQLCEVKLFYGTGTNSYVTAHSQTVHTQYGHSSETFTDDTIATAAEAQTKANSILAHRRFEDKTYNVTVGPLTDEQVLCVKHGQLIQIKARAIPDADDAFRSMRIAQCRYTTPIVGIWFAHLQLGRPWKMEPYSKGPPLVPNASGSGDTPEPIGLTGSSGTDTDTFANSDHIHAHGTFGTNDLHTEYVREAELTARGDMARATGAGVWTRLPIGASNTHLVSDGLDPLWTPHSDTGGGGGGGAPTAAKYVTIEGHADLSAEKVRIDLYNYSPDNTPATTPAVSDEFDDGSLAAAWGWDSTPGTVDESTYSGFLYVDGDSTERHLNRAWAPGAVDITLAAKVAHTEIPGGEASTGFGIYLGDATGNPANSVLWQIEDSGVMRAYNENASVFSPLFGGTAVGLADLVFGEFYIMIQRTNSGPTWRFYFSHHGKLWHQFGTTGSKSLTIAALGIRADTDGPWMVDWIRAWSSLVTKVGS